MLSCSRRTPAFPFFPKKASEARPPPTISLKRLRYRGKFNSLSGCAGFRRRRGLIPSVIGEASTTRCRVATTQASRHDGPICVNPPLRLGSTVDGHFLTSSPFPKSQVYPWQCISPGLGGLPDNAGHHSQTGGGRGGEGGGEKKQGQGGVGIGVKGRRGNCRNERRSREGDHGGSARREEGTSRRRRRTMLSSTTTNWRLAMMTSRVCSRKRRARAESSL